MDGEDEPEYVGKFEFKQIAPAATSSGVKAPFPTEVDDWDGEVDESGDYLTRPTCSLQLALLTYTSYGFGSMV